MAYANSPTDNNQPSVQRNNNTIVELQITLAYENRHKIHQEITCNRGYIARTLHSLTRDPNILRIDLSPWQPH